MIQKRNIARVFAPLLEPARYKGAYGGRGSGKSHFFGEQLVEDALCHRGLLSVCIREVQRTLAQSSKRLIEHKIRSLGVTGEFRIFKDRIETPGDGLIIFTGMQDHWPHLDPRPAGRWGLFSYHGGNLVAPAGKSQISGT